MTLAGCSRQGATAPPPIVEVPEQCLLDRHGTAGTAAMGALQRRDRGGDWPDSDPTWRKLLTASRTCRGERGWTADQTRQAVDMVMARARMDGEAVALRRYGYQAATFRAAAATLSDADLLQAEHVGDNHGTVRLLEAAGRGGIKLVIVSPEGTMAFMALLADSAGYAADFRRFAGVLTVPRDGSVRPVGACTPLGPVLGAFRNQNIDPTKRIHYERDRRPREEDRRRASRRRSR